MKSLYIFLLSLFLAVSASAQWVITDEDCNLNFADGGVSVRTIPKEKIVLEIIPAGHPLNDATVDNVFVRYEGRYAVELPYNETTIGVTSYASAELLRQAILALLNDNDCLGGGGDGSVTSVGLTMPSAFSVANSPVTTSGTLAVTGAGTTSQYIRGDGSLATFSTGWAVTGNSGLTAGTNFLGTTDNTDVQFKRNSVESFRIYSNDRYLMGDSGTSNLSIGVSAGRNLTTGFKNLFIGCHAGMSNTEGDWNTFIGDTAGKANTTGDQNTFIGHAAGMDNQTGGLNVAVGVNAFEFATATSSATCVGNAAGRNITGTNATCIGSSAATVATSADETTAIGGGALAALTTGDNNTALGRGAGAVITTGGTNVFLGQGSGSAFNTSSSDNIIIGAGAADGTAGAKNNNVVLGSNALGNTAGNNNIAFLQRGGLTYKMNSNISVANSFYINGLASQSNEMVLGGVGFANNVYYNKIYFNGRMAQVANLQAVTLQPNSVTDSIWSTSMATSPSSLFGAKVTNGSAAAADLILAGAQGTGSGAGGDVHVFSAPAGAAGTAVSNSLDTALTVTGEGAIVLGGASEQAINTTAGDAATIQFVRGRFRKDTSGSTFTLTSRHIVANSIILLTPANAAIDATATTWTVNAGAGSATIELNAAPTSNFDMNFFILN